MIRPYRKGYLPVSGGHRLYYECCGNPSGVPLLFLHGGPGSGFVDRHKKSFDLKRFNLVLFDQRGAGRSKPFASLKDNTTPLLVSDIDRVLDHVGFEKALIVGGSWGATLALVYAIRHPERVAGLMLRAIFLGDDASVRYFFAGSIKQHAPETWERFIQQVPAPHRSRAPEYYFKKMTTGPSAERRKFCYEWARYEMAVVGLRMTERQVEKYVHEYSFMSLAPLEAHYLRNACFIPRNYILKNAHKLSNIPVSILHGRYDIICPARDAYRLHKKIRGSRYHAVCAGHSGPEYKKLERQVLRRLIRSLRSEW